MGFITGAWQNTKLICGHHGDDMTHEMTLNQFGKSLFYVCPNYYEETRKEGECNCTNKLPLKDYEKVLGHIADTIIQADLNDKVIHLENYEWRNRSGVKFKVLKHRPTETVIRMIDPKTMCQKP